MSDYQTPLPITAIILAAGYGTRMYPVTQNKYPKHLHPIAGKTLLDHTIKPFQEANCENIVAILSTFAPMIIEHISGKNINHFVLAKPTDTISEARQAATELDIKNDIILAEGDSIRVNLDVRKLYEHHVRSGARSTVLATSRPLDVAQAYHGVFFDDQTKVRKIRQPDEGSVNQFPTLGLVVLSQKAMTELQKAGEKVTSWSEMLDFLHAIGDMYAHVQEIEYFNINAPEVAERAALYLQQTSADSA